jgi:hypothetical protein
VSTLRRALRFLRFALVCLALSWGSAPAAAAPLTDTIVLVVASRAPAAAAALAPRPAVERALGPAAAPVTAAASPSLVAPSAPCPPRRLYLEQRALLC